MCGHSRKVMQWPAFWNLSSHVSSLIKTCCQCSIFYFLVKKYGSWVKRANLLNDQSGKKPKFIKDEKRESVMWSLLGAPNLEKKTFLFTRKHFSFYQMMLSIAKFFSVNVRWRISDKLKRIGKDYKHKRMKRVAEKWTKKEKRQQRRLSGDPYKRFQRVNDHRSMNTKEDSGGSLQVNWLLSEILDWKSNINSSQANRCPAGWHSVWFFCQPWVLG